MGDGFTKNQYMGKSPKKWGHGQFANLSGGEAWRKRVGCVFEMGGREKFDINNFTFNSFINI